MFCPHCSSPIDAAHNPQAAGRCATCQLLIGPGRALHAPDAENNPATFMARSAKHAGAEPVSKADVLAALRAVAEQLGCRVERMRMTDYDQAIRDAPTGPTVAQVLATFGSWKAARRHAAQRLDTTSQHLRAEQRAFGADG